MGTNYYLKLGHEERCPTCGASKAPEQLHIGKSSMGWVFSLHIIPELGIHDLADWARRWSQIGWIIEDEYGRVVAPEEMMKIIAERAGDERIWDEPPWRHNSWESFHAQNQSEQGPKGLIRSRIGRHCVGHGAGTWSLFTGEYS